jgi:TonB-dependent SusC/RagA subfamily outer membrane receptor
MQTQEIAIKPNVKIIMKSDSEMLDEVMVVAYGTAKKSAFTGSASTIKSEKIAAVQTSNVTDALAGQVAGVQVTKSNGQPGSGSSVRIRGIGSFSASNTPLYVVDGIPYDGDIAAINTQDIESMTVLKDAAANALYGARGANGVVIITTKKGATGEARVTLDAKWGTNRRAVPQYEMIKSPSTYYETMYKGLYNASYDSAIKGGSAPEQAAISAHASANANIFTGEGGVGYQVYTVPDGQYFIGRNGRINPNAMLGYSDGQFFYTPDNWADELLDDSNLRQEYNLTMSGGKDGLTYYASLGYLDDSGIIPGSAFTRYSARIGVCNFYRCSILAFSKLYRTRNSENRCRSSIHFRFHLYRNC